MKGRLFFRLVLLVHLAVVMLMAGTGLIPLLLGGPPRGWILLLHGGGAALYLVSLALLAVCFSGANYLATRERCVLIVLLWSGVVTAATMTLAMTPLFATEGQILLVATHKWSSIVAALAGLGFVLLGLLRPWPTDTSPRR